MREATAIQAITDTIKPFLPHLTPVGMKALDQAEEKFGGEAWDKVERLWPKIASSFQGAEKEKLVQALKEIQASDCSEEKLETLVELVKNKLKSSPGLAVELLPILGGLGPIDELLSGEGGGIANLMKGFLS